MSECAACPRAEALAAFVEGRLSADERREVVLHLDRCELCYRTVVETARFQSEEEPRGRVIGRGRFGVGRTWWLGAAAAAALVAAALLVFPVWRVDPERPIVDTLPASDPGDGLVSALSSETFASVAENLWLAWPEEGPAMSFAPPAREVLGFRVGVRLADLRLAAAAGDDGAYETALRRMERTLESGGPRTEVAGELARALDAGGQVARSEAVEALSAALADRADPDAIALGLWAESSRIAAAAEDHDFFSSRAFISGLYRLPSDRIPTELSALKANGSALDPARMNEIETALRTVIRDSGGTPP